MQGSILRCVLRCWVIQLVVSEMLAYSGGDLIVNRSSMESSRHRLSKSNVIPHTANGSRSYITGTEASYPSNIPSFQPSTEPTLDCQDSSTYRNPKYPALACEDHKVVPCENWKSVGLDITEVEILISSCPLSCDKPCKSTIEPSISPSTQPSITLWPTLSPYFIEIVIFIYPIDTYINDEHINSFQKLSLKYLSEYLTIVHGDKVPSLKSLTLNSQKFVNERKLRHDRELTNSRTLRVVTTVAALSNSIGREDLAKNLRDGVDSAGFTEIIRGVLNLQGLSLSSTNEPDIANQTMQPSKEKSKTQGGITVVVTSFVLIACVMIAVMINRRRLRMQHFTNLSPNNWHQQFDEESPESRISDKNGSSSFDDSIPKPRDHCIENFRLRVDECDLKRTIKSSKKVPSSQSEPIPTNIIPPMIVIDNIDDDNTESSPNPLTTIKDHKDMGLDGDNNEGVMRVSNIGASSAMAASFSTKKPGNSIQAYLLFKECTTHLSQIDTNKNEKSPLSLISSRPSIGETASAISTPASILTGREKNFNNENSPSKKKGVFTFDPNIDMEPEDDFTVLFEKKMKEGGKRSFNLKDLFKRNKTADEERSSAQLSHYESDAEQSEMSSVVRGKDRLAELENIHSPSVQTFIQEIKDCSSMIDNEHIATSIENQFSPNHQQLGIRTLDHEGVSPSTSHKRTTSVTSVSTGFFYTFEAPISGKLGVVIKSTIQHKTDKPLSPPPQKSYGPTIWEIKGYSPLLGMVRPGDIIVSVDGINAKNMSTGEITGLLAQKRSEKGDIDEKIKITVMSRELKTGFEPEPSDKFIFDEEEAVDLPDSDSLKDDTSKGGSASESDGSFHLIGTGMSDDNDSYHMMAGAEDYL